MRKSYPTRSKNMPQKKVVTKKGNVRKNGKKVYLTISQMFSGVINVFAGALCGLFIAKYALDTYFENGTKAIIPLGAAILLAIFLPIIVHELGHMVFGLLTGYKFQSFRVGSFMINNENGKLKFRRFSLMGTAGQCLMSPPDLVDGKVPYTLYNFGGSIFNALFAVISLAVYFVVPRDTFFSSFFICFATINLVNAVINGIPMKFEGVDNDGLNALSLGDDPQAIESYWLQLKVNEMGIQGNRLKDMPEEWFYLPEKKQLTNSLTATRGVLTCNRLMDMHSFKEAEEAIETMLDKSITIAAVHKYLLITDLIFCMLLKNNVEKGKLEKLMDKDYQKFLKQMANYPSVIRTQYAYALKIDNDKDKAAKMLAKFNRLYKTYPNKVDLESEKELIGCFNEKYSSSDTTYSAYDE